MKKSFFLSLVIIFFFTKTSAQSELLAINSQIQQSLRQGFISSLRQEHSVAEFRSKNFNISAIALFRFSCHSDELNLNLIRSNCLIADTNAGYVIFRDGNTLVGYGEKGQNGQFKNYSTHPISVAANGKAELKMQIVLAEYVKNYSDVYFFIKFSDGENWRRKPVIGFLDKQGMIKLLDTTKHILTISEFVCRNYGSVEKFEEITTLNEERESLFSKIFILDDTTQTIKNSIDILKNNFRSTCRYFPADTLKIFQSFVTELTRIVNVNDCEMNLLKNQMRLLKVTNFKVEESYENNLRAIIQAILTVEDYEKYLRKIAQVNFLASEAANFLYYYFSAANQSIANSLKRDETTNGQIKALLEK